jgi:centromeric protein E
MSNESSMNASQSSLSLSGQSFIVPAIEEDDWNGGPAASQNVVVCVRVRPGGKDCNEELLWSMDAENNRITPTDQHPSIAKRSGSSSFSKSSLLTPTADSGDSNEFRFDSLVLPSMNTSSMYEANISPIIDAVVGGYNGTVFAYGQTGSGKTHTMSGSDSEKGVIPRAVEEIFEKVEKVSLSPSPSGFCIIRHPRLIL